MTTSYEKAMIALEKSNKKNKSLEAKIRRLEMELYELRAQVVNEATFMESK